MSSSPPEATNKPLRATGHFQWPNATRRLPVRPVFRKTAGLDFEMAGIGVAPDELIEERPWGFQYRQGAPCAVM
jgi:hypothetical protein